MSGYWVDMNCIDCGMLLVKVPYNTRRCKRCRKHREYVRYYAKKKREKMERGICSGQAGIGSPNKKKSDKENRDQLDPQMQKWREIHESYLRMKK